MNLKEIHIFPKILLFWYLVIFFSTELLSYLHLVNRISLLLVNILFFSSVLIFLNKQIRQSVSQINIKSRVNQLILLILLLTFIQGIGSAPSTTDAMGYHIPRVIHWLNNGTTIQTSIVNFHDFMPPFPEYILLHLYLIAGGDRLLFFSQWIAFAASIFLSGEVFLLLKGDRKITEWVRLLVALIPIALLESVSTQVDLQSSVFILMALYLSLILIQSKRIIFSLVLGSALGLGMLTKQTFAAFAIVPGSLLLYFIKRNWLKGITASVVVVFLILVMQFSFFSQNIRLYGNFSGQSLRGEKNIFFNEMISPQAAFSNMLKNASINLPMPVGREVAENVLMSLSSLIGVDINDPRINYNPSLKFHLLPIIYPQEDMVSNPIQLLLIAIAGGVLILNRKRINNVMVVYLYTFLIISFFVFSLILNFNIYNIRVEIPMFMIGTILAVQILSETELGRKILKAALFVSFPLGAMLILFNVGRPYIPYGFFYEKVKAFAPKNAGIPEAFYIRPREQQYFNARYYWFDPYSKVADLILKTKSNPRIKIDLMDEFEYPFWELLNTRGINFTINDKKEYGPQDLIFSTSKLPYSKAGYQTVCFKTSVDYGYACLSKQEIN